MTDPFLFIDIVSADRISGWCINGDDINQPVKLLFYGDDHKIGETYANQHREDLQSLKFHPTGDCGFDFPIPDPAAVKNYSCLFIRSPGAENHLQQIRTGEIPGVSEARLPKVFFMHIPKTAGTSFNTFVRSHFPENSVAIHIEDMDPETYGVLDKEKNYLAGHLPLRVIKDRFDISKFKLITMLRDPYFQLHSHINWVKKIGADPDGIYFLKHHTLFQDLTRALNESDFSVVDNLVSLTRDLPANLVSLFDNNQTRHLLERESSRVCESDFHVAIKNLDCFSLVGTTEQYPQFTSAFCQLCGLTNVDRKDQFNKSKGEKLFDSQDETVRTKLLPLVEYDLMLYDHVVNNGVKSGLNI